MIRELHRFRYSDDTDMAIGRDDDGVLYFQSWGPDYETGGRAEKPLGWHGYLPHYGLEEAEELLRLKEQAAALAAARVHNLRHAQEAVSEIAGRDLALRRLFAAVEECDQKATRYGDSDDDHVTAYIMPSGCWHRLLGLVRGATPPAVQPPVPAPVDREALGREVRLEWMSWAREQPNPKPSWLLPWEELSEPEREVDRRIGERIVRLGGRASPPQCAVCGHPAGECKGEYRYRHEPEAPVPAVQPPADPLAHLRSLAPGWDSYSAHPPTAEALATAEAMLAPPHVVPTVRGGVQLEWPAQEIEVEIAPSGLLAVDEVDPEAVLLLRGAEPLARRFHALYESLAPRFGYSARPETRQFDPTTDNGRLMIAVCGRLLTAVPAEGPCARALRELVRLRLGKWDAREWINAWAAARSALAGQPEPEDTPTARPEQEHQHHQANVRTIIGAKQWALRLLPAGLGLVPESPLESMLAEVGRELVELRARPAVDVVAVRQVAAELRPPPGSDAIGDAWFSSLAARLDAALGGADQEKLEIPRLRLRVPDLGHGGDAEARQLADDSEGRAARIRAKLDAAHAPDPLQREHDQAWLRISENLRQVEADRRHRDLVELAAAVLSGPLAHRYEKVEREVTRIAAVVLDAIDRAERGREGMALVPLEPPDSIKNSGEHLDEELFDLCRRDDYRGLYKALVRRATGREK